MRSINGGVVPLLQNPIPRGELVERLREREAQAEELTELHRDWDVPSFYNKDAKQRTCRNLNIRRGSA